jgi:hypothetical protein
MPSSNSSELQTPTTSCQGQEIFLTNDEERRFAFESAFDYRGDVTLILQNGESIQGFLFNREPVGNPPFVSLLQKGVSEPKEVLYNDVKQLIFSGKDTADGKSYEAWKAKKQSEREAEAKRIEEEMRVKGYL